MSAFWRHTFFSVVSFLLVISLLGTAQAHDQAAWHTVSVHSVSDKEWTCVDTIDSTGVNYQTGLNAVRDTLVWDVPPAGYYRWDSIAWDGSGYRIYFAFETSDHCRNLSNLSSMRMRTYIMDTTPGVCGGTACVVKGGQIGSTHNFNYYTVYTKTAHYQQGDDFRRHVLNHEFGHTLGITHGDCSIYSVMHSDDYCVGRFPPWPYWVDYNSVVDIADNAS